MVQIRSVVDPDPIRSGTFRPGRIQIQIIASDPDLRPEPTSFIKKPALILPGTYFRPGFVNCCLCPSPHQSVSTPPPPPTLPCVKYVCTYCMHVPVCKGGGGYGGSGPQTDKHLPQSPITGQVFWMMSFSFYGMGSLITTRIIGTGTTTTSTGR